MNLTYDIDNKIRFIVLYQDVTKTPTRINKHTGIPLSTVHDWVNKIEHGQDILEVQQGRGRKAVIDKNTATNLIRKSQRSPEKSSVRKLGSQYGISKSSAYNVLKGKGLEYKSVRMEIELTEKEMNKRIKFCKQMLRKNGEKIYNTFFSDEMGINLSEAHINKAWAPAGTRMEIEKPRKNVHLNCWGAISYFGATSLHIFKEPLKAGVYEGIIKSHLEEMDQIYPEGYYFQHDNSSVHKAAEKEATKMGLEILDFPTYSPDLSPIENLWSTLKSAVAADSPKTEAQLIRSLRRNWEKVTTENALKPYFEELEDRYLDCIECNGALLHC